MPGYTATIAIKPRPAATLDRYGKETFDWGAVSPVPVELPVSIQPASQAETTADFREQVTWVWRLISQPGQDVALSQSDRVVWLGTEYEVTDLARWPHPMTVGAVHHVEARLERITG